MELTISKLFAVITDEDIAAQAFIFVFAGFETVATALAFMAHELAVNPEVQERLRDEIDAAILENEGQLKYESVQGMKYLDMVVCGKFLKCTRQGKILQ